MRILFLTSAFPPEAEGAATHLPEIAEALQQKGHRVDVLAIVNRHEVKDTYSFRVKRISRSQVSLVRNFRILWQLVKEGRKANVFYTYGVWWQAAIASMITGTPWVVKFTGDKLWEESVENNQTEADLLDWNSAKKSGWLQLRHNLTKFFAKFVHRYVVSCDTLCQVLLNWNIDRERIEIVPNALPKNPRDEDEATYLAQWADQKDLRLITAGHISRSKNCEVILEALELKPNVRLVVAGDGPYIERVKELTREKKLADRVLFTGKIPRNDMSGYLKECDILVMSSLIGRFNYTLLEGLAQKKVMFASQRGLHSDFIENGVTGWTFSPYDSRELVELIESYEKQELVLTDTPPPPSWEVYVDQTNDVLKSIRL